MNKKGNVMGVVLAIVLIVAVAIPVVSSVVAASNATGTTLTILNLLPLFLAIGGLVTVGAIAGMR